MMKRSLLFAVVFLVLIVVSRGQETEDDDDDTGEQEQKSWWERFKEKVKNVFSKWRDDIRGLWDEVLSKASDLGSWTREMYESLKRKMREWIESKPEIPEEEKNEIETFISKLKVPQETAEKDDV